jgi:uncharacterized protein (TIGR00369 family)
MVDPEHARSFAETPANRLLGSELVARSERAARLRLPVRADLVQEAGVVQGGFLATLADSAAVQVLLPDLTEGEELTSVEFKLNFLRPAHADGPELIADAALVKRGRRISLLDVELRQGDRLVARGLFTYLTTRA